MTSAASLLTSSFRVVSDGSADVSAKQMTYLAFSFLVIIYSNAGMVGSREDLLDPQTPRARDSRENRKLHIQVLLQLSTLQESGVTAHPNAEGAVG